MAPAGRSVGFRLGSLAERLAGTVEGDDGSFWIAELATLDTAGPASLAFLTDARHREAAQSSAAGALLVARSTPDRAGFGRPLLVVDDPGLALNDLLGAFFAPPPAPAAGVHPAAHVDPSAAVDPAASVGPFAVVGPGSSLAAGVILHPHAVVGRNCRLGVDVVLHPHAVLYDDTELGERVVVHSGAVIGSDGFGYQTRRGTHHKVPQVGRVVIEADVEVGANTTIDRAMLAETRIGAGTKIDNQVQVGHNVRVGRGCLLCGQAGIAGSATLEDGVVLAGQSGVAGHLSVGRGVQVAAKSAVLQAVAAGAKVAGIPAVELGVWRRQAMLVRRLPELLRRLRRLERESEAEDAGGADSAGAGDDQR